MADKNAPGPATARPGVLSLNIREKAALFASLFLLAFGLGLIMDGKKLYNRQVKISQRVDYKSTLNPYTN